MVQISKVGVIGAGLMGSGIAAQVTNAGVQVVLLDIVPPDSEDRNVVAAEGLKKLRRSKPASFMDQDNAKLITIGNLEDDLDLLKDCDWICEAVVENLEVKQNVYRKINDCRRSGSIVTSNTSTIPRASLVEGMSAEFKSDFAITHFFNPPRYMRLLEIVSGPETRSEVLSLLSEFMAIQLGKEVVHCKDTPGFIANRIGIFWSMVAMQTAVNMGLSVEEADAIVGRPMGIPKSGIFGLMDLTGIDLKDHVLGSMQASLPENDAFHQHFDPKHPLNPLTEKMVSEGYVGRKGKGGFYRLVGKGDHKKKEVIDFETGEYRELNKPSLESVKAARSGLRALVEYDDKGGAYAWQVIAHTLKYAADLIPEIADDIVAVDAAMKSGYAWKWGPFEQIDQLGSAWFADALEQDGLRVPNILRAAEGRPLYREADTGLQYMTLSGDYEALPLSEGSWKLADFKRNALPLESNGSASIWDVGDGVACLEFHSKMNSIDSSSIDMVRKAASINKRGFRALIIGNDADNFSVGANIGMGLFAANAAMWPVLDQTVKAGQDAYLALKYAPFPVVAAPAGMALGGGCEICLHSDAVQAHAELYMGLVEVGVGLIPGWGGTKEMIIRHVANTNRPGGPMPPVMEAFQTIGMAQVSKSASEARRLLFLRASDQITMNRSRLLSDAKLRALELALDYKPPVQDQEISLPGPSGKTALTMAVLELEKVGKATKHDLVVAAELAEILCGGATDITESLIEKDLLALERAAMSRLFKESATLDRIEHMLETGKPLRN